ncbi:hypothetical protein TWF694_008206 [Orbilia ellipsospora]|uniref:F-box domain-containing protein n=1 Tax=Orbilia ellipsospora TaxID=2528407 RepID=A0AAV9XFE3_9PEZI
MPTTTDHQRPSDVFAIPEILILILTELPTIELLNTARAVCKLWQTTIDSVSTLRWKTWSQGTPTPPPSLRPLYPNDCQTSCSENGNSTCVEHPYSNTFEVSPLALHIVQRVWRMCHSQQQGDNLSLPNLCLGNTSTATADLLSYVGSKLRQLREASSRPATNKDAAYGDEDYSGSFCPSTALLRPYSHARNIWIYAGVHRSVYGMDTRTYHYNPTTPEGGNNEDVVTLNFLANTLLEGWQIRKREMKCGRSNSTPYFRISQENEATEEQYYALVIQIFGNSTDTVPGQGTVGDTEITIKLQMVEPYEIVSVETSRNPKNHQLNSMIRWSALTNADTYVKLLCK